MTAPGRALFLAASTAVDDADERIELVPALSAASRIARHHGIPPARQPAPGSLELRLPGIGGRYLQGVAAHVEALGWPAGDAAALVAAIEDRCSMWIVCSPPRALVRAGLASDTARLRRAGAARFAGGRWSRAPIPAPVTVTELVRAGYARGAVCAAAESGRGPRSGIVRAAAAAAGGARTASMERGLAAALGARWAVELLVAPAIPPGSLVGLREQVAVAPRCSWCRAPLIGSTCRRCMPARP
jgi:hypothetical protein